MSASSNLSVLIVDDNPEQIRFVSEILKSELNKIYAATSCADAEKILERHIPDLLILDIIMPGMDGLSFCQKLKSEKRTADIPVIFATAYNDVENIVRSFAVGGSDYVVKPFIREELLERVKVRIRLSQQEKELKRAYEELDKFCYSVSHDIRAPLNVIRQLSALLENELNDGDKDEVMKISGMLMEKSSKAASMVEGLHKFSRAFYEKMSCGTINMNQLFAEVFAELQMLEKDRIINFSKEELPPVWGDIALIHLVVQNLLSNAIKFTRECKDARIRVSAREEGNMIFFTVEDNGCGIDDVYSGELFQVFCKHHNNPDYEGDGIGLASVNRIVKRHGGDVKIVSKLKEGTCVQFSLPKESGIKSII